MAQKALQIGANQRFGSLTVIRYHGKNSHGDRTFLCRCDCGNTHVVTASDLNSGNTTSCGLCKRENHKHSDDRLYSVWCSMKARCNNPNNQKYSCYGGRGIKVCDKWMHSFTAFYEWAIANGYDYDAPYGQCTIDRMDVDGDYEPSNCRWVDAKAQSANRRPRKQEVHGIELDYGGRHYISISELARDYGIDSARLERRVHRMTIDEALNEIRASIINEEGLLKSVRYVSESQWNEVIRLHECGISYREIGERLKMSKLTAARVVKRHRSGQGPYKNKLPEKLLGISGGPRP